MIKKSERIKQLVASCTEAYIDLDKGQYQNGSYSRYAGDHTQIVLKSLISELNFLREEILREEVLQELPVAASVVFKI